MSVSKRLNSSKAGRRLLRAGAIARHPWEYGLRWLAARRLSAGQPPVALDRSAGFGRFGLGDFEALPSVVRLAARLYEEKRPWLGRHINARKKEFMEEILTDDDLRRHPEFVAFCLSSPVIRAVSRYLGTVPVLRRVGLLLSSPADTNADSRLYHLDPEDFRQVKIFVNVFDVAPDEGPFTWLPGNVSDAVLKRVWRREREAGVERDQFRRWSDDEVEEAAADCLQLTGPAGTGAFVDTSRCLHFGSRIRPGAMRLVFYAQYLRYHFAYPTDRNEIEAPEQASESPLVKLLLAARPGRTPYAAAPA